MNTGGNKILITTGGLGSRLGDLTKYTNKSLVRIGKKPALSYIVENYSDDIPIVVTLGHFGQNVKDFLSLAYPNKNFEFVEVDNFSHEGSSLLYSILQAKELLQCPFIFHACDTIISEKHLKVDSNWLLGSKKGDASQYRSFDILEDKISKINEKGQLKYDFNYTGVCGIKDYKIFWELSEQMYIKETLNNSLSDCHVIRKMLDICSFYYKETLTWQDIGNVDSLLKTKELLDNNFKILDKEDESIFIFDDSVIKFFHDKQVCRNRIIRAEHLKGIVPKILNFTDNFYKYEKVEGHTLSDVIDINKFIALLKYCSDNLWLEVKADNFLQTCKLFYREKTKERIIKSLNKHNLKDKEENINGLKIPKINTLIENIDFNWLCDSVPSQFHGDFILDNIIYNNGEFKLIDWRQDFGGELKYGDKYYDIAKLNHSLVINHNLINKNLFFIKNECSNIHCDVLRSSILCDCQKILKEYAIANNLDLNKINILTSLIWVNMSPLHEYPLSLFLFYFGKYNLYNSLNTFNETLYRSNID